MSSTASLNLTLCRYNGAKELLREDVDLLSTQYIAISHIWMQASWRKVSGIPFDVLVSQQKADFIEQRLPELVGSSYFWMDVLAVDQSKEEARIKVVEHIPAVYNNASRTIVVREDHGYGVCCQAEFDLRVESFREGALHGYTPQLYPNVNEDNNSGSESTPTSHFHTSHPYWPGEVWLHRLWPWQETMLSDTLEFTVCKRKKRERQSMDYAPLTHRLIQYSDGVSDLILMAFNWAGGDDLELLTIDAAHSSQKMQQVLQLAEKFISAVITNGTVRRTKSVPDQLSRKSIFTTFLQSGSSLRKTGKARDFVLALFPTYDWYKLPHSTNIRKMAFGDIWADAAHQLLRSHKKMKAKSLGFDVNQLVKPRITEGVLNNFRALLECDGHAATDIPTPEILSEFCSLFSLGRSDILDPKVGVAEDDDTFWYLERLDASSLSMEDVIILIGEAVFTEIMDLEQPHTTFLTDLVTIGKHYVDNRRGRSMSEAEEASQRAYSVFFEIAQIYRNFKMAVEDDSGNQPVLVFAQEWEELREFVLGLGDDGVALKSALLRLSALRLNGFGVNSLQWSEAKLDPYILELSGQDQTTAETYNAPRMLALAAPDLILEDADEIKVFGHNSPYLVVQSPRDDMQPRIVGLAPQRSMFWLQRTRSYLHFDLWLKDGCPFATRRTRKERTFDYSLARYHVVLKQQVAEEALRDEPGNWALSVGTNMAIDRLNMNSLQEAVEWHAIALLCYNKILGREHDDTMEWLSQGATLLFLSAEYDEALNTIAELLVRMNTRRSQRLVSDKFADQILAGIIDFLVEILVSAPSYHQEDREEGEVVIDQAPVEHNPAIFISAIKLANLLSKNGYRKPALRLCKILSTVMQESLLNSRDPSIWKIVAYLCHLYFKMGLFALAKELIARCDMLEMEESNFCPWSCDICDKPGKLVRWYKCLDCEDYDLCDACARQGNDSTHSSHRFAHVDSQGNVSLIKSPRSLSYTLGSVILPITIGAVLITIFFARRRWGHL